MKQNVCGREKGVRAGLGAVIIIAGLIFGSWWGLIGIIPLLTAQFGYCPVSHAFHYSSCPVSATQ